MAVLLGTFVWHPVFHWTH